MSADPRETRAVYDRHAVAYDAHRAQILFERRWLERFAAALPPGGRVLDLGCGAGRPIAGWLLGEGFRVTGVDFSAPMLALARERFPEGDWRLADMRALDLGERFAGIVGWDSFFHLTADEQRACLPRLAGHLESGGALMLTVGPEDGVVEGRVEGEPVHHASLSPAEYATRLEACGLTLKAFVAEDPDCDLHTVLIARQVERRPGESVA